MDMKRPTRRDFLMSGAGLTLAAGRSTPAAAARAQPGATGPRRRILLKGGCVLSLDASVGDFDRADVLIEGSRISSIAPDVRAEADVIDASNCIVMPGFVDTHRHMWQGALRNILPNGLLSDYMRDILGTFRPAYRPEDVYIGDLVTALGAINAGVTTLLDWSHIGSSPEHTDAAIEGLRASGVRAVYAYGDGAPGPANRYPQDIRRLRARLFASSDQLLTLAMAAGTNPSDWAIAREVGARISVHVSGPNQLQRLEPAMRPDVTYIHCTNLTGEEWRLIARTGGSVSIACPIEMEMGHGVPPIQEALDHGVRPSLSTDVETQMPGDFFTQMRAVFTLQRMLRLSRQPAAESAALLTVRDVVGLATIEGARANGLGSKIGTLSPGKDADVILLRTDLINVMPVNDAYGAVVLGMDTSNVDTVIIGGVVRKSGGRLVGVDMNRIARDVQASREHILTKAGRPLTRVR
jgi:cytosine/adenosine deaminase-related metal-dependent hydrolase